jgi:hypothetical protein
LESRCVKEFATLTCKSLSCGSLDKTYLVAISERDCNARKRYEALMGAAKSYCNESLEMINGQTFDDKTQMIDIARCPFCDMVHSPVSHLARGNNVTNGNLGFCGRQIKAWCEERDFVLTVWNRCQGCRPLDIDVLEDVYYFLFMPMAVGRRLVTTRS